MDNNESKSTIKILSEREKSIAIDSPPNFKEIYYIRYHNNKNGKLSEKE